MSTSQQQRQQQQQFEDYEAFNQQQQYQQLSALQQQFMQKQINSGTQMQSNYIDNETNSAYGSQLQNNLVSGRYPQMSNINNGPLNTNQVDSHRNNLANFNLQTPSQQNQKGMQQIYPQNILSQFSATAGLGQQTLPQPDLNLMSQFSMKDGPGSMTPNVANIGAFGGGSANMFGANLASLNQGIQPNLLQELLKIQGNNMGGITPLSSQQQQNNQPVFGQGFLNAASLLANIQQLQQPTDKSPSSHLQQSSGNSNNMLALQQFMNINSNLGQYQSLIDQIEKQQPIQNQQLNNFTNNSNFGVVGAAPSNARPSQQPNSQVSSPLQNMPSYSSSLPTQAPSYLNQAIPTPLNSSMLPSQSDLIRQPLKTSAQNYHDLAHLQQEVQSQAPPQVPQHQNYSYLMGNKTAYEMHQQQQQNEQENLLQTSQSSKNDYMYQEVKNTVSNPTPKAYNPNAYSNKDNLKKPNVALSADEYSYDPQSYSVQRSPAGSQKQIGIPQAASRRNNNEGGGSPRVQWLSGNNARSTQNEPLQYLSNNYGAQKFSDDQNSPPNKNSGNRAYHNDIYAGVNPNLQQNLLDSSFNRQGANNAVNNVYHLNASQNSSQIEHHLSGNYSKPQATIFNQQSPGGSSNFRFDDAPHNQNPDSSMNLGRSQRLGATNGMSNLSQQAINIDDIPIGGASKPKTFEEILEENLRKMGQDPVAQVEIRDEEDGARQNKKEFLKRKSQKSNAAAAPAKKYNYYVENFEEGKKKEPRSTSAAPESSNLGFIKNNANHEDTQIFAKPNLNNSNHQLLESTPNQNKRRPVSPIDNYNDRNSDQNPSKSNKQAVKKSFLTRGSGTAGGKQGHPIPAVNQKQKGQQKQNQKKNNPLLSDDEYPNDFNFAAEQDNKSPKLNNPYLSRQAMVNNKKINDLNRNSIDEFEKLEQECSKQTNQVVAAKKVNTSAVQQYPQQQQKKNQRRKKLFDDSDSNDDDDDDIEDNPNHQNLSQQILEDNKPQNKSAILQGSHANSENEDNSKSSIVKKFFYKEDPSKKPPSQIPRIPPSHSSEGSSQLEAAMKQKMEQLDRAIEAYNQQSEAAQKLKREYDSLLQKQRVDFRDFEGKKKKELEDLERLRNDELEKLKKERKAFEQKQRNMQMVQTSNKKEREEIDYLKKELQRVQEEAKAKEVKAKTHIERLSKQSEEFKLKNRELQDELKHLSEQISSTKATVQRSSNNPINTSSSSLNQQAAAANRYTFSASNNNKSQESANTQQQQQQPKSILKNKGSVEEQRPVSANYFYNEPLHEDKYEDEDDEVDEGNFGGDQHHSDDDGDGEHHNQSEEDEDPHRSRSNNNNSSHQRIPYSNISDNIVSQVRHEDNTSRQGQNVSTTQMPPRNDPQNEVEEDGEDFDMKFPPHYHNKTTANIKVVEQIIGNDGKIQRVYENGKKEVIFNNGVKREVFPDGYTIVYFNNNDIKQTYADQRVVYYFAEARTTQTTFPDGLQVFKFANNQIEKHFPDGTKEIIFPDGTIKCIFADGEEESIFPDGTIQRIEKNGVKAIEFANGQKDIMFPDGTKIREYPDGKVRKTYSDGKTEYSHRHSSQQP